MWVGEFRQKMETTTLAPVENWPEVFTALAVHGPY
jgi:hypothetical protein